MTAAEQGGCFFFGALVLMAPFFPFSPLFPPLSEFATGLGRGVFSPLFLAILEGDIGYVIPFFFIPLFITIAYSTLVSLGIGGGSALPSGGKG